ncbi:TetR/AcrR family transcriptional regulator [Frankia tisae]|uniref:TetR/AcrR family transcriptional regulator n=1 Tax=Frankia tisae TaxID=2950104 RepID=UPI0021C1B085|nr:TetR/AcrR family transcriptional regulator [Frankia tisae]
MTANWDIDTWSAATADGPRTSRQSDLFDALVEIFLAEGFARFTLADLAGRLRCSKSTLYTLAHSKEQLAIVVVVHFFRSAAERIDDSLLAAADPADRLRCYLDGVAAELRPASAAFRADLAAFPPARAIYERNTSFAAAKLRTLVAEGVAAGVFREVDARFVGQVATLAMVGIQQGTIERETGLADADAYAQLAGLLLHGLARRDGDAAHGQQIRAVPAITAPETVE